MFHQFGTSVFDVPHKINIVKQLRMKLSRAFYFLRPSVQKKVEREWYSSASEELAEQMERDYCARVPESSCGLHWSSDQTDTLGWGPRSLSLEDNGGGRGHASRRVQYGGSHNVHLNLANDSLKHVIWRIVKGDLWYNSLAYSIYIHTGA